MGDFVIRPYQSTDRQSVRNICYETGFMGEPVDWLWPDKESFADLFTIYYTDVEPESAFVVEAISDDRTGDSRQPNKIIGYLTGCIDTRKIPSHIDIAFKHLFMRALPLRPSMARILWRSARDIVVDAVAMHTLLQNELIDPRWPSHLHIDLLPEARGKGVGRMLIDTWINRLVEVGSPGCHLRTLAENHNAIKFFETVGFSKWGDPTPVPGFRTRQLERMHVQSMVRPL